MANRQILLATSNEHKLREFRHMLEPDSIEVLSISDVGITELPEETGATFDDNAFIKARYCAQQTGMLTAADDSGLAVRELGGFPGVESVRWAGPDASDADRNRLLLERLQGVEDRSAIFMCVIAIAHLQDIEEAFRGMLSGSITEEPRGENGFGYDPIFYVPQLGKTMAELTPDEKNEISHRGTALRLAKNWLHEYFEKH